MEGTKVSFSLSHFHYCQMVLRRRKEGNANRVLSHAYTGNTSHGSRVLRSSSNSKTNHNYLEASFRPRRLTIFCKFIIHTSFSFESMIRPALFSRRKALPASSHRRLSTSMHHDRLEREGKDTCRVAKSTIFFFSSDVIPRAWIGPSDSVLLERGRDAKKQRGKKF